MAVTLVRARAGGAIAATQAVPVPVYNESRGVFAIVDGALTAHQLSEMLRKPYASALPFARGRSARGGRRGPHTARCRANDRRRVGDMRGRWATAQRGSSASAWQLHVGIVGFRTQSRSLRRSECERMAAVSSQTSLRYPLS
ncbi:hypothetical protein PsYK624_170290 [Phanerochaete sordida]|uniref:Uncharacterized protein n=1 Tax=Phanerochaete sordida TaxID=48140 RepID=A0A9P3GRY3_9APHY|nr:hypothetical protein PsYK624_170290 [Phanerochaete sordida]